MRRLRTASVCGYAGWPPGCSPYPGPCPRRSFPRARRAQPIRRSAVLTRRARPTLPATPHALPPSADLGRATPDAPHPPRSCGSPRPPSRSAGRVPSPPIKPRCDGTRSRRSASLALCARKARDPPHSGREPEGFGLPAPESGIPNSRGSIPAAQIGTTNGTTAVPDKQKALRMQGFLVAGAGFEPATFGL
jgi:hypothetical protein